MATAERKGLYTQGVKDRTKQAKRFPKKMRVREVFKIVIGDNWCAPVVTSSAQSSADLGQQRSEAEEIDYGRIRDKLDIRVAGTSICERTEADSVFFLIRDMLLAVDKLAGGEEIARVSFYEGPWELVLQRVGSRAYLTFYRSGRRPQVIVKDKPVAFKALVTGVVESAEDLISRANQIDPLAEKDPLIAEIRQTASQVKKRVRDFRNEGQSKPVQTDPVRSTRWHKPRTEGSFSFGFQLLPSFTDLLAPGKPQGNDLSGLLFRGQHVVHARGRRRLLGQGFLFLQTERLLASLRQLLSAWEEGRPMSVRLISDGLIIGVRLGSDDGLSVSLMDSSSEDTIVVVNDLTPWEYADAVLGVARELRRVIVDINPHQRRNLRLEGFSREIRSLANWAKEQRRGVVINEDIERYQNQPKIRPVHGSRVVLGEASRLRFQEYWRIEVESPDLSGTLLCGNIAVISSRNSVLGIDTENGAMAWRREYPAVETRSQLVGGDGFVRASQNGTVELVDLHMGVVRWKTELLPRSGGAPVLLVIEHGPTPGLILVAEKERRIVALDVRSGEPRWRFTAARGGTFALRRFGRLIYISSNDSHFNAVDVEDGSLVWRFTDRTRFLTPPAVSGDRVLVVGGRPGRPEGRMYALNAFSGKKHWSTPLGGGAVTAPIVADGVALVPVRTGRRHDFVGVDVSSGEILWRRACSGWADPSALMTLDRRFIVNSAGGTIRAIGAKDGEERWTTRLGPTCSDDVPLNLRVVLRGGMLFVPADTVYVVKPEDGHIVHSLGGDPPVPDLLHVDPSCAVFVAEDSGHMAMFGLSSCLRVVS